MTNDTPLFPRPLSALTGDAARRVLTARSLRAHGVPTATADDRCRPGGPWQELLPGVYVLHAGRPTSEERLWAVLLYAGRDPVPPAPASAAGAGAGGPDRDGPEGSGGGGATGGSRPWRERGPMITGPAALALHGFVSAPPLPALDRIDVLVAGAGGPRSTGCARLVREPAAHALPEPEEAGGLPVAPVPRALADTLRHCADPVLARRLLVESVRAGHCEVPPVVRELGAAGLFAVPHVRDAVDDLLAEDRALAEGRLHELVLRHDLPTPCWNVDLRLPGGEALGAFDAYWPEHAVAVELDTRVPPRPRPGGPGATGGHATRAASVRRREHLAELGVAVIRLTPHELRTAMDQQAAVVRTALMAAMERAPAEYVVVLPR